MCTATHPHRETPGVDKAEAKAKVFFDGKARPVFIQETPEHIIGQVTRNERVIVFTNLDDEASAIPTNRFVSVVGVKPRKRRVDADPAILHGLQVRIRSAAAVAYDLDAPGSPTGDAQVVRDMVPEADRSRYVCIQAEDLAEALVLITDGGFTDPVWINPVVPERAVRRYLKVARLVCEAETLVNEANAPVEAEATYLADEAKDQGDDAPPTIEIT